LATTENMLAFGCSKKLAHLYIHP